MDASQYLKKTLPLLAFLIGVLALGIGVAVISPRHARHVQQSPEAELRQDLGQLRAALAKYHADSGKYPDTLDELVKRNYLGKIPADPLTGSTTTWMLVTSGTEEGGISDVHSGAPGSAQDGTAFSEW